MFRFASLGSGSRGNATLVQSEHTTLLIDCGYSVKEVIKRAASLNVDLAETDALLLTHEHFDHRKGIGALSRHFNIPVWMTYGTYRAIDIGEIADLCLFHSTNERFTIGDIDFIPTIVPHDAKEPTQFIFEHKDLTLGLLTDLGKKTPYLVDKYSKLNALLIECNYDQKMLEEGPYSKSLIARVGGKYGHFSNDQAADFLLSIDYFQLCHLVIGHISEKNNEPEIIRRTLSKAIPNVTNYLTILEQDRISNWFDIRAQ